MDQEEECDLFEPEGEEALVRSKIHVENLDHVATGSINQETE